MYMSHICESYVHVREVDHPRNTSPESGRMVRDETINNDEEQSMSLDAKAHKAGTNHLHT